MHDQSSSVVTISGVSSYVIYPQFPVCHRGLLDYNRNFVLDLSVRFLRAYAFLDACPADIEKSFSDEFRLFLHLY